MSSPRFVDEIGGLSHLVEAATALSQLGESSPVYQSGDNKNEVDQSHADHVVSDDDEEKNKKVIARCKREIFPQRLMAILSDPTLLDVVTWLPNGCSFVIIRPDVFTDKVLPKYLPPIDARGSTKYPSFTRKLNRWGFRQVTRGPDTGAFHHPLFRRDQYQLCLDMVCQRSRERKVSKPGQNLPPKKRIVGASCVRQCVTPGGESSHNKSASTISLDDNRSTTSNTVSESSATSLGETVTCNTALPPSTVLTPLKSPDVKPLLSLVSTDADLMEGALRKREENERLRIAQAMLYNSYLKAVNGE